MLQVELDESNGDPEGVTHGVGTLAFGTVDQTGLVPGAPGARQPANSASMQKALRVHLVDLDGATGLTGLRVFGDPPEPGWSLWTNGHEVEATYAGSRILTYLPPTTALDRVPHPVPTSDPGQANLGIGGLLTGVLAAPGASDYAYLQLRAAATVAQGFDAPLYLAYESIG